MSEPFISIAGNIGSGKSTLTTILAQRFSWKPAYEIVDANPYLSDFYRDMPRWAFQLQMFFLTSRYRTQKELMKASSAIIQDRTIYEDGEVFAKNLFLQGQMDERDYQTYYKHYQILLEDLRTPDLLVYLRSDVETLKKRIEKRGRDYERSIPTEYLEQLNQQYESWVKNYRLSPVVVVDVTKQDFLNVPRHLEQISSVIAWELQCLKNKEQRPLPLPPSRPLSRSPSSYTN